MKYGKIEGIDVPVSRIFLGTAGRRFLAGEDCSDILDAALANGINAIDTARNYGVSESSIATIQSCPPVKLSKS